MWRCHHHQGQHQGCPGQWRVSKSQCLSTDPDHSVLMSYLWLAQVPIVLPQTIPGVWVVPVLRTAPARGDPGRCQGCSGVLKDAMRLADPESQSSHTKRQKLVRIWKPGKVYLTANAALHLHLVPMLMWLHLVALVWRARSFKTTVFCFYFYSTVWNFLPPFFKWQFLDRSTHTHKLL